MSSLEHRREMPRREEPFEGEPIGIGILSGFWLVPLIIFLSVIALGIYLTYL
jgi:hypothetical protein